MAIEVVDLPNSVSNLYQQHAVNGAQGQADGARLHAELLRSVYLKGMGMVSFAESLGVRHTEESGSSRARETTAGAPPNR